MLKKEDHPFMLFKNLNCLVYSILPTPHWPAYRFTHNKADGVAMNTAGTEVLTM